MPDTEDFSTNPEWTDWLAERPESVRAVAIKYPPWAAYRLKSTGQQARIRSYEEQTDGTVTVRVLVWQAFAPSFTLREVFGVSPGNLDVDPSTEQEVMGG